LLLCSKVSKKIPEEEYASNSLIVAAYLTQKSTSS
jgi:hypothetical protein